MNYQQALQAHIMTLPPALRLKALTSTTVESCMAQIRSGHRAEAAYSEALREIEAGKRANKGKRGF